MPEFARSRGAFVERARERLLPGAGLLAHDGETVRPAAVLVPVVERRQELTVLLTRRSHELPTHAGQIAFPGGKIDAQDDGPLAAALRETYEETGVAGRFVEPVGFLDTYETGTGFAIVPVVAMLREGFDLVPEPGEVAEIFEVPLRFLMNPQNHRREQAMWKGRLRSYDAMPYGRHYIWGATAGMLLDLYRRMKDDV